MTQGLRKMYVSSGHLCQLFPKKHQIKGSDFTILFKLQDPQSGVSCCSSILNSSIRLLMHLSLGSKQCISLFNKHLNSRFQNVKINLLLQYFIFLFRFYILLLGAVHKLRNAFWGSWQSKESKCLPKFKSKQFSQFSLFCPEEQCAKIFARFDISVLISKKLKLIVVTFDQIQ